MQYLRGYRALRNDPGWVSKLLIGSLLWMLQNFIIPQIVFVGWLALTLRRAVSGQDTPLPRLDFDFNYLGKLLMGGFRGFLTRLLWGLPVVLMIVMIVFSCYGSMFAMAFAAQDGEGPGAGILIGLASVVLVCMVLGLLFSLPMHVAIMRVEITDDLNQAGRFGDILRTTRLLAKELLLGAIVMQLIGTVATFAGMLCFFVGVYPAIVLTQILNTYWHAELYRVYLEKGGEPLPVGPLKVEGAAEAPAQAAVTGT